MGELFTERTWYNIIDAIYAKHAKIEIPSDFKNRVNEIDVLLDNDYTGVVKTVYEFMISTATVPFTFVTDNENLSNMLQNWSDNELNFDVNIDIPKGLRDLSTQYYRERWRSSFIVLNIAWDKIDGYVLPSRMWFSDSKGISVEGKVNTLDGKKYSFGDKQLISTDDRTVLIRKPFSANYSISTTPYLVSKGVLYNSKVKEALVKKQADILEEIIPYLLLLKAGDANLLQKNMLTNLDSDLDKLKDSLKKYKRDYAYRTQEGDSILKGRYDLSVEHFIPELGKIFNEGIIKPVNWNILAGLGLIELEGFSGSRQEAIWNPKVLVEEIVDAVLDWQLMLEEVVQLIIKKNASLHRKQMNKDIRLVPGVIKAFLTDDMKKLVKDYANTGQLSVQDSFEALPFGFDFEINRKRRLQERDRGDEDLFFPRVILNQDSNTRMDTPTRPNMTPNEVPQKKKEEEEASLEEIEARIDITENYIRIRQVEPDKFEKNSFRTITISKEKGIKAIVGRLKDEKTTTVQSYLFDKKKWTVDEAKQWIKEHKATIEEAKKTSFVICSKCDYKFDLNKVPEKSMGITQCPNCKQDLTNNEMIEAKEVDLEAPYTKNSDLPKSVQVLPQSGQTLWRKIFNQSLANGDSEDIARKKAWAGVKRIYKHKDDGTWVKAIKASTIDDLEEDIKAILTIPEQIKIIKEE